MIAKLNGGPAAGRAVEVEEPPPQPYIWEESALLEPVPEGEEYPAEELEQHRYDLERYEPDPSVRDPRATYSYGGKIPSPEWPP
jgi:hypothetical protein